MKAPYVCSVQCFSIDVYCPGEKLCIYQMIHHYINVVYIIPFDMMDVLQIDYDCKSCCGTFVTSCELAYFYIISSIEDKPVSFKLIYTLCKLCLMCSLTVPVAKV